MNAGWTTPGGGSTRAARLAPLTGGSEGRASGFRLAATAKRRHLKLEQKLLSHVAIGPLYPQSGTYRDRLWYGCWDRAGNINLTFGGYIYPAHDAPQATGLQQVRLTALGNLNCKTIAWDPNWRAASGGDGQVIILDPTTDREWNLWQVSFSGGTVTATNGNLVPGSYGTKVDGFAPSRGCGIQDFAMLVRPQEIADGVIRHALSMPLKGIDRWICVPPPIKMDGSCSGTSNGVPEGMRFCLRVSDSEIQSCIASLPASLGSTTRQSDRAIARALRDYGWFITDDAGSVYLRFEDHLTAAARWNALRLGRISAASKEYPCDLHDDLLQRDRIRATGPRDQY